MVKRTLIFVHRWLGVALCALFLLWFPSGIGMMYWTFPGVTAADRLDRSPPLTASQIRLTPQQAAERIGIQATPAQIRLNTFDGRPVYRFAGRGGPRIVYADTGEERGEVRAEQRDRIAAAWTGQPAGGARIESVTEVDQWTVGGQLRNLRPLYKYTWADGAQLYVAGETGEVMQYTTRGSRLRAYLSAIPHWVYFTPLRQRQPLWLQFMIWTALIGTVGALLGVLIGAWMYSPRRQYRRGGAPARLPYRGQKRWHTILGLVFGLATITWTFSGMLSLDPFPSVMARFQPEPAAEAPTAADLGSALRGRAALDDFAAVDPAAVVARNPDLAIKELEFTSFAGQPLLAANLGRSTRLLSLDGTPIGALNHDRIAEAVRAAVPDPSTTVRFRVVDQYDAYYLDRRRERPLPVLLARLDDPQRTRFYIDPATGRVVGSYSSRNWISRWLYNGLHSLDFPWLYNYRPLWDIVVIVFMLGGTALSVTGAILAWRVVGRRLAGIAVRRDAGAATQRGA